MLLHPAIIPRKRDRPPREILTLRISSAPFPAHLDSAINPWTGELDTREELESLTRVNSADRRRYSELAEMFPQLPWQPGFWEILEKWWRSRTDVKPESEEDHSLLGPGNMDDRTEETEKLIDPLLQERMEEQEASFYGQSLADMHDIGRPSVSIEPATPALVQSMSRTSISKPTSLKDETDVNIELVSYFQALNTTILRHLRFLLSDAETQRDGTLGIPARQLEDLGLHPRYDALLVERLARIYFAEFGDVRVLPEITLAERLRQRIQAASASRTDTSNTDHTTSQSPKNSARLLNIAHDVQDDEEANSVYSGGSRGMVADDEASSIVTNSHNDSMQGSKLQRSSSRGSSSGKPSWAKERRLGAGRVTMGSFSATGSLQNRSLTPVNGAGSDDDWNV